MKTIPPAASSAPAGRQYWRSLDQLADTPEFKQWLEREFPASASEPSDAISRRHFVKIMSASFLLGGVGLTGCRRPVETVQPFARMPEDYIYGVPQYYATALPTHGSAIPLVVKSSDGRPTKIEGNAEHPDSNGGTDLFAQGSLLDLYDPDRAMRCTRNGTDVTSAAALDFLSQLSTRLAANQGQGLAFLVEPSSSPSRVRLQNLLSQRLPQARWFSHEAVALDRPRAAAVLAFGKAVSPCCRLAKAKVILSLDCDLLGAEGDAHRSIREFARGRKLAKASDPMNRLYVMESLMTLTGANADHRLRLPAGAVLPVSAALAAAVLKQAPVAGSEAIAESLARLADAGALRAIGQAVEATDAAWLEKWIQGCAEDLLAAKANSVVVAGHRQPVAVHLLALALNTALGSVGASADAPLQLLDWPEAKAGSIQELAKALQSGGVETLVIVGGNPVYSVPADLDWARTQRLAKTLVRMGYYEYETFPVCDWHFPAAHYLESWGDARTADGTLTAIQPLIEPLFGGFTELELLARLGGLETFSSYAVVRETFKSLSGESGFEEAWKKFLHFGFTKLGALAATEAKYDWGKAAGLLDATSLAARPSRESLEVVFHRDYSLDDGRYNNNGWLQELPDPITKISWDNAVLVSYRTAKELALKNQDVVEVALGGGTVRGPIWIQPGMADFSLGLALGYGRERTGRVGRQAGFNAFPLKTTAADHIAAGAKLRAVGSTYPLSVTQEHWSMEGRPIIREAALKHYRENADFVKEMDRETPPSTRPLYPNPLDRLKATALHQWGMSIDLNACVGCSACVLACQSENNIPIVGKEQVGRGREMHWIRIDRYYTADPVKKADHSVLSGDSKQPQESWIQSPQVAIQPMLCQHCEAAPCENVCPVNATVHDDEGLNVMVYNRCVGTRYCSNNCPYKVRRFNYFDYNKRPIQNHQLYLGPLAKKPADEWELMKLVRNPDVTARMRGVMEKCSYCLQRIEQAKIAQKIKAGASADVVVPDGTIQTACQQACPAEAIVFGNVADPNSHVSQIKKHERTYQVLEFLSTKPRTTYLAKIRNPNPRMPDYYEAPMSSQEFNAEEANRGVNEHEANPGARETTEKGVH